MTPRRLLPWAIALTVAALLTAAPAFGRSQQTLHHKPFKQMTLTELAQFQQRSIHFHHRAVRYWLKQRRNHTRIFRGLLDLTPPMRRCKALGIRAPHDTCFHASAWRWTTKEYAETRTRIAARAAAAARPAHYALWMCIHGGEGSWDNQDTGHNSHYGGLQMTLGWDGRVGNAGLMTPLAQMQAAEAGYAAHGHSRSWLSGQWGQTIGPCWKYAD